MKTSAGILLYRRDAGAVSVLLAHPGGPFWARRDDGAWSVPKGEFDPAAEDPMSAAAREFREEIGADVPEGPWTDLGIVQQSRAKSVHVFAVAADFDPVVTTELRVEMVWPPRSGRTVSFPEVDRIEWFALDRARIKILAGQRPALDALGAVLGP